tara:strand:+ start:166 stop:564 length:399 start_codon:yes stop_codon:yes gene_type:complete
MAWFTLHVIALICVASAFGRMIFFTMAFGPTVFRKLERRQATWLMRQVLRNLAVLQGAGAVILLPANCYGIEVGTLAISCIVNLLLRQFLLPCIDRVRVSEPAAFSQLYQLSVIINIGLFATVPTVLAGRAQ